MLKARGQGGSIVRNIANGQSQEYNNKYQTNCPRGEGEAIYRNKAKVRIMVNQALNHEQ